MATITWLDKIDGLDLLNPQKNVNADDMNQIKTAVNTNDSNTTSALANKADTTYVDSQITAANAYADAKVANNLTASTTVAPSKTAVNTALAAKADADTILASFVEGEVPSGAINGVNTVYTIANTPITGSVQWFWNGVKSRVGVGHTISGTTITMTIAPETGDTLETNYRK